jgi:hypothetical protein
MGKELKMKRMTSLALCVTMLLMLLGCSDDDGAVPDQEVTVSEVNMITQLSSIGVGESIQLEVDVTPKEAGNLQVFWSSTNEFVATVDETGVLTAHAAGEVRVFAISIDNPKKSDLLDIQVLKEAL